MSLLVIEILDRFGKIKERHRIKNFPCSIGRDYNNNIIIDDPYISPTHITINTAELNTFSIDDNDSKNGLFSLQPFTKKQSITIKNDSRIRIGHTDIRFRFTDHPIRETLEERNKPSKISMLLTSGFILPIVWLLFGASLILNNYIEYTGIVTFQRLLSDAFPVLIFIVIWAIAWSIVSKIVTHRFYFAYHTMWACCLTLVSLIIENLANYFEFSFSLSGSASIFNLIFGIIVTSVLLYGHLRYSTTFSVKKSKLSAVTASIIILGLVEFLSFLHAPEFSNKPSYSGIIKPSVYMLTQRQSLDTFFNSTNSLKLKIDELIESNKTKD